MCPHHDKQLQSASQQEVTEVLWMTGKDDQGGWEEEEGEKEEEEEDVRKEVVTGIWL